MSDRWVVQTFRQGRFGEPWNFIKKLGMNATDKEIFSLKCANCGYEAGKHTMEGKCNRGSRNTYLRIILGISCKGLAKLCKQ